MELLQKLTFYDLLGYTLPGTILLELLQWNIHNGRLSICQPTSYWVMLIILGFLTGIIISEITDRVIRCVKKVFAWVHEKVLKREKASPLEKICAECGIKKSQLFQKLSGKNMLIDDNLNADNIEFKDMEKHLSWIYALIQRDPKSRIHSYASGALLYKNMVLVLAVALIYGCAIHSKLEIAVSIIGIAAFGMRYSKFNRKKYIYSLCWFMSDQLE